MTDISATGRLIAYKLEGLGKSKKWLAESIGTTESFIAHVFSGRNALSVELMAKVSQVLMIPLSDLEYARAVQRGMCELALDTPRRRAAALALLRVWRACGDTELGQIQRLSETIHIEMMSGR